MLVNKVRILFAGAQEPVEVPNPRYVDSDGSIVSIGYETKKQMLVSVHSIISIDVEEK